MPSIDDVKLSVTTDALSQLADEALKHPGDENGCGIIGLVFATGEIVVTSVIPVAAMEIIRHVASLRFGGNEQRAALEWMDANFLAENPGITGVENAYLGKAHSHHTLAFYRLSGTDEESALNAVKMGIKITVWPLLLITRDVETTKPNGKGTIGVTRVDSVNVKFYYLDEKMVANGETKPKLVTPKVIKASDLSVKLPKLAWRWVKEDIYSRQLRQLKEHEAEVAVYPKNTDADPELELQFVITKTGWKGSVLIATNYDYPVTPPKILVVSDFDPDKSGLEVRELINDVKGEPLWSSRSDFIDIILQLEKDEVL